MVVIMRILLISEDESLILTIVSYLKTIKINYDISNKKDDSYSFIDQDGYDLFVIDSLLGNTFVYDAVDAIRLVDKLTPILVVNCFNDPNYLESIYKHNINDCLRKPFILEEFKVKIEQHMFNTESQIIKFNDTFYYNKNSKVLFNNNKQIELTHKESRFLHLLIININNTVPYDIIYDFVWNGEEKDTYFSRYLVSNIRKKLPYDIIKTIPKTGYKIINNHF